MVVVVVVVGLLSSREICVYSYSTYIIYITIGHRREERGLHFGKKKRLFKPI